MKLLEMERVSKHISFAEATKSQAATRLGIDNKPNLEQLESMRIVANEVFEEVRAYVGGPVAITSFYRHPDVNKAIGGSANSQHCKGQAIDIDCDIFGGKTNAEVFLFIKKVLDFDQLIWEFGDDVNPAWVHASFVSHSANRNQILRAYPGGRYELI